MDMTLNWEHVRKLQGSHRGEMDTSTGSMDWDDRWLCSNMNISELRSRFSSSLSSTEKQNWALGRRIQCLSKGCFDSLLSLSKAK